MSAIIQTNHLSKRYQSVYAVKKASIQINKGDIYGFIGLNGAGKTTLIRMLLGMVRPTEGSAYIMGEKVRLANHHIWKNVGYMVETPQAYPELTVRENLDLYRKLRLVSRPNAVSDAMRQLHLERYAKRKAKNLSLGNKQRLGIAKALLHQPEILILDESVNGLDPQGMVEIRQLLQDLAHNHGVTILISSHLLNEITQIANLIGIIHEGEFIEEIESRTLDQRLHRRLVIDSRDNAAAASLLAEYGYDAIVNEHGSIEVTNQKAILHPDDVATRMTQEGFPPTRLTVLEEDFESYFLKKIKGKGATYL